MMRPLAELDPARCAALEGVVFDVDDTITEEGRVPAEAFARLWRLREAGLHLIAVTGRPLGWTDGMAACWPLTAAVGENGAGGAHLGARAGVSLFHLDDVEAMAPRRLALAAEVARVIPSLPAASDQMARRMDLAFDIGERRRASDDELSALADVAAEHGASLSVSSVHAHLALGRWDKALGAQEAVRRALGLELERGDPRWLFVGDSGNDAAAFAFFARTVGVANVRDHLDRLAVPPAFVTRAPRAAGFVELAEHVLAARSEAS